MKVRAEELVVVHRDKHLIVVIKPPTIATTAPDDGPSLFGLVRELDAGAPQLHPLSRLDTQVSGLVSFARTKHANEVALQARREAKFQRRYLGLCSAQLQPSAGAWTARIALHNRDVKKRRALAEHERGIAVKDARTIYQSFASAGPLVALHLWPQTGRTHQLRVHAAHAGAPLLGDVAYGGEKRTTLANGRVLSAQRVMLHCAHVRLPDPSALGQVLTFDLDPPDDMAALWRAAGGTDLTLQARPSDSVEETRA
jgi:23S rRNA-/tRNA-specific pseudouridylate synthase